MRQDVTASGSAQQVVQGSGIQYINLGLESEPAISIAPPFGQRDENLPLRGRDDLLAELAGGTGQAHVIHGLGGCGKTRLALEAAYQAQRLGAEVWWISAADESGLVTGMRALGRRLGIADHEINHGDTADLLWQHLKGRLDPWLLVLDNTDDPQVLAGPGRFVSDGQGWLRPVSAPFGTVLITSR
jgi:hypothetical protein